MSLFFDLTADAVHNSGRALSKFVGDAGLNLIASEPVWGLISPMVVEIVLDRVQVTKWVLQAHVPPAVQAFSNMEVPTHVEKAQKDYETWEDDEEPDDGCEPDFDDGPED